MGRTKVRQRDLPVLLLELRDKGASKVSRRPAQFDGSVEVTWDDPESTLITDRDLCTDVRALMPAYILGGAFFLLVVVVYAFIQIFGGGMS